MNKTDKIMEDIFGVEFEDVRTSKKKIRKKNKEGIITSNNEGLDIINGNSNFVEWKAGRKKWIFDPDKNILEWTSWDLFEFAHRLYIKRYNKDWDLLRNGNSRVILQIFEKLENRFGSNNYLLMKDYVVFFFEKHIDNFIKRKNNNFSFFDYMNREDVMKSFCGSYDYMRNILKYNEIKNDEEHKRITNKDLENAYLLSINSLVSNYGIILSVNWLVLKKKFKKKEAAKAVFNVCKTMYDKGVFNMIIKSTESNSPYPDWLIFKKINIITDRIDKNINMNVKFINNENKSLDFLK